VLGASGDLAKKKTFPALFDLFRHQYIPASVNIVGYARSELPYEQFCAKIKSFLKGTEEEILAFLARCSYHAGAYDSSEDFIKLHNSLTALELNNKCGCTGSNRLFYFAIPPNIFIPAASAISENAQSHHGWTRVVVEKPFGHDLTSAVDMSRRLQALWREDQIYRIDHYLGKEMVQNLTIFRFGNTFLEPLLNNRHVSVVKISFKEDFGTMGRGGYFDNYGIIRDIMQNHLMQVLTLVAMEPPVRVAGEGYPNYIRDSKVNVLRAIPPLRLEDVIIGQYVANESGDKGYLDDPTVPPDSNTPTFAQVVLRVRTPRWEGVPFIMKAGKALDERKAEIRIQFKDAPAADYLFNGEGCPRNELVMRLQPSEAVYMKVSPLSAPPPSSAPMWSQVNVKKPGLFTSMEQSELDLSYHTRYPPYSSCLLSSLFRFPNVYSPDAYTRLLLDTLRGSQATFVRSDELEASWQIFDPLLKEMEASKKQPLPYVYGSRGPPEADEFAENIFTRNSQYSWNNR
jgi:glucose-6-phosphate 1-dehydrogenase